MKWERKTLDELGVVSRGKSKFRPRNDPSLFGGKYPFIQTADVKKADFYITEFNETYNEKGLAQSKLWNVGTLCITIAANIADTAILAINACFPDSIMGFVPYEDKSDVRFVKYLLDVFQNDCKQISQGTAQDNLSWEKLSTIKFLVPDITTQRRIADILSAYDDLIENNRKQIKLLEEAAQRLYKEWFVELRFPGHEKVKVTDGVPEGWEKSKAKDFFDISIGRTPARVHREWYSENIGLRWVSISDMCDGVYIFETKEKLTEEALEQNRIVALPIGTVLLSFKLTVGRVSISSVPLYSNEAIAHFYADNMDFRVYTFLYLKNYDYETLGSTSGIGKAINSTIIKNMPFLKPSSSILEKFGRIAGVYFEQIALKEKQIKLLQEARDRLLPKLMSGEIEV